MKKLNQKSKILIGVISLIFLATSMPLIQAFSAPIPTQLVVKLDDTATVNTAISNLKQNTKNIAIVEYGSTEYDLTYWRTLGAVIWVSHGTDEGVSINGKLASWDQLEAPILRTPNKDVVLACYSGSLLQQTELSSNDVLTFDDEIDSVIGSLLVSYLVTKDSTILPKVTSRLLEVYTNPTQYDPLAFVVDDGGGGTTPPPSYVIGHLSSVELTYWLLSAFLLFVLILCNFFIPESFSFVQATGVRLAVAGWSGILLTLVYLGRGQITVASAIVSICSWVIDALGILIECFYQAPLWEQIVFGIAGFLALVALGLELAGDAVSGGAVTAAKILGATASIIVLCVHVWQDYDDLDTIVG
ncbi:MAG: hypothetical protein KGD64_02960 [Candidatus Heimdallarchaeota archaeon]|nr:hypothetical protein [Candidatus Heimdallarchaeota archaeon]